ncbi:hypothetical protein TSAR_013982 [Trichomalopsis sarcophagae]|uniref:Acid phosphatase n=1 Tax=Trichomalopsis sarcophagae TaxID=543379 RepID=A0A232F586_9HYME|nr:hypothetical protein TSAR_013982 [Trichomalopsis sarcophagae]
MAALPVFFALLVVAGCSPVIREDLKLELVQVLFRHGERTPQANESKLIGNSSRALQEPWGYSQLTNNGKRQEYKIGQLLRERYSEFLGELFRPEYVHAVSSDYDRTKASLQLVLASLYTPSDELVWNKDLDWMPIPTHYAPKKLDALFSMWTECPKFDKAWQKLMKSSDIKQQVTQFEDLFKNLSQYYPETDFDLEQLFYMNNLLIIESSLDVPYPEWYTPELHQQISKGSKLYLDTLSYTPGLIRLNGGPLTRRFVENLNVKSKHVNSRKIYLYSGHEFTLYAFAKAHNITLVKSPVYGSAIILEKLRNCDGDIFVKMYLWTGVSEELQPIKLPNCDEYCRVDDYLNLVQTSLPSDDEMRCLYKNLKPTDLEKIMASDVLGTISD